MNLKTARIATGKTQVQVAAKAKVTETCYQRYESGDRIPRADTAILIAEALNIKDLGQFKKLFSQEPRKMK